MSQETLAILGAGAFGTALADLVAQAGRPVLLVAQHEATARAINETHRHEARLPGVALSPRIRAITDLAEATATARLLVLAAPSRRVRDLVPELARHVDGRHMIVHAIGALVAAPGDEACELRVSELIRRETAVRRIGAMAGPALARDLVEKRPAALVVGSPFREVVALAQAMLAQPPALRVYGTADLAGVELAAAAAGAFTLGLGLGDALGFGAGPRALLITRAVAEAGRLAQAAGGQARTMTGLAGLGNLLVRSSPGSSEGSDDYQLGLRLARGERPEKESEGSRTLPALVRLAVQLGVRAPILHMLEAAAHQGVPIGKAVGGLLDHPAEDE
jgi:glycerol-3-phosphate dehydrogenase (NAD(P)+)